MTDQRCILLIDDDAALLRLLATAFENAGHTPCMATGGRAGMKLFSSMTPDVVVTDILMPDQEGIETIMAMKKARPAVRIIAMSGGGLMPGADVLKLAARLGADGVIVKPFRPSDLVAMVAEMAAPAAT